MLGPFGKPARKGTCSATNLQGFTALRGNAPEQETVVVVVVRPTFVVEQGKSIEVLLNNAHLDGQYNSQPERRAVPTNFSRTKKKPLPKSTEAFVIDRFDPTI